MAVNYYMALKRQNNGVVSAKRIKHLGITNSLPGNLLLCQIKRLSYRTEIITKINLNQKICIKTSVYVKCEING